MKRPVRSETKELEPIFISIVAADHRLLFTCLRVWLRWRVPSVRFAMNSPASRCCADFCARPALFGLTGMVSMEDTEGWKALESWMSPLRFSAERDLASGLAACWWSWLQGMILILYRSFSPRFWSVCAYLDEQVFEQLVVSRGRPEHYA